MTTKKNNITCIINKNRDFPRRCITTTEREIHLKIIHICQYYNEGWGYQENLLPLYQKKIGHDVAVITSDRRPFYPSDPIERIVGTGTYYDRGVRIERLPIRFEFRNRFVVFKDLENQLKREKPDYIFHHNLPCPSLVTSAKYKKNADKHVFLAADNHADLNISGRNSMWRLIYYRLLWGNILKNISANLDVVFCVTPLRCQFPHQYLGIPKSKIHFLPIGADVNWNEGKDDTWDRKTVLNGLPIDNDDILIVSGGKMDPPKNINILLDAIKILNDPQIKLVLFGRIGYRELRGKIESQKNVFFKGWLNREETMKLLSVADIAVWPGIHTTLVEDAIAVGTPLILRYYGSTSHHIKGNGSYLHSADPNELAAKIKHIITSPQTMAAMKKSAENQQKALSYIAIAKESVDTVCKIGRD